MPRWRLTALPHAGLTVALLIGLLGVGLVLAGAAAGWSGPLVTCGVDAAAVCVRWPAPVAALVWLGFLGVVAALAAWHLRAWRHPPR